MFSGWELAFGLGALALFFTLAYGVYESRHAGAAADRAAEAGAKRIYDNPSETDAPPKGGPRKKAPPLVWIMVGLLAAWLVMLVFMRDGADTDYGRTPPAPADSTQVR